MGEGDVDEGRVVNNTTASAEVAKARLDAAAQYPGLSSDQIEASARLCHRITRREARNFYWGLRLTPEPRRSSLYAIYAWMRRADDLADDEPDLARAAAGLAEMREITLRVVNQEPVPTEGFWPAFAATVNGHPIEPRWLIDMLDGVCEDLSHRGYETSQGLDRYRYRVGGTVGLCSMAVWGLTHGADSERAAAAADVRGRAFQMINILRDIAVDAKSSRPRVYVPREVLRRHEISIEQLRGAEEPVRCEALVREMIAVARWELAASATLDDMIAADCRPVLRAMTTIYAELLSRIESDPVRSLRCAPVRVPTWRKLAIMWGARGA